MEDKPPGTPSPPLGAKGRLGAAFALGDTAEDSRHGGAPTPTVRAPTFTRGALLDRFLVLGEIGAGGMGVVLAAYDPDLDRKVAIKLLRTDTGARFDPHVRARLVREAKAIASLSHPNVITVHEVGVVGTDVFCVMELIEGGTLAEWTRQEKRPWREVLARYVLAGRGLAAAHAAGLVHRDFKPDNVLCGRDGRVRVTDFGLAARATTLEEARAEEIAAARDRGGAGKEPDTAPDRPTAKAAASVAVNEELEDELSVSGLIESARRSAERGRPSLLSAGPLTIAGSVLGTPLYMSPEQHRGEPADARSDQFAFCVALYRALCGQHPFAGTRSADILAAIEAGQLRPAPAEHAPPARVMRPIARGLDAQPGRRHPSMDALLADLEAAVAPPRGRRLAAAAVVAALAAGTVVVLWPRSPAACRGAERRLRGVWDEPARRRIEGAFRATGRPYADSAARTAAEMIDVYTADWVAAQTAACEATRVRGEQSEAALDLSTSCLTRRLDDVRALVRALAAADGEVVDRAATAAESLPSIIDCADVERLASPLALPTDPHARAAVEHVRAALAEVRVLRELARYGPARLLAGGCVAAARAAGHAPLEAEALLLLGRAEQYAGDPRRSERTLTDALLVAEAAHDDEDAAEAALSLVYTTGVNLERAADGLRWAELAGAILARLGGRDDERAIVLLQNRGGCYYTAGRLQDAERDFREALAMRERVSGRGHPRARGIHQNLGLTLEAAGRLDEAQAQLEKALALAESARGPAHPEVADVVESLGVLAQRRGDNDHAAELFERSLSIREAALGPDHIDVATSMQNLGNLYGNRGDHQRAKGYLAQARDTFERALGADSPAVAEVLLSLADEQLALDDAAGAVATCRRAVAIRDAATAAGQPDWSRAHIALGYALREAKDYAGAAEQFRLVIERGTAAEGAAGTHVLYASFELGRTELASGAPAAAIAPLERALAGWPEELDDLRPSLELQLAKALRGAGRDAARARELGEAARKHAKEKGDEGVVKAAEEWLRGR